MQPLKPHLFCTVIIDWAKTHGRHDLPWQHNRSPYSVHVSEVMLQQTQVTTVIPYFERWMASFPDIEKLACAEDDQLMHHWQGLGYYSRARRLRQAAEHLLEQHHGSYPEELGLLEKIPGVGRYTAGAIYSFAFNRPGPIVDGNVKRLFCRYFGIEGISTSSTVTKRLWQLAEDYTPDHHCRSYAQGLLDMGATLCRTKKPDCNRCPLNASCYALAHNLVLTLPTPAPKKRLPTRYQQFLWCQKDDRLWLSKRPSPGIWENLWCLPEAPEDQIREVSCHTVGHFKHTFSHYKLDAEILRMSAQSPETEGAWFNRQQIDNLGLPTPIRKFIYKHFDPDTPKVTIKL